MPAPSNRFRQPQPLAGICLGVLALLGLAAAPGKTPAADPSRPDVLWLDELDLSQMQQGFYRRPQKNKSIMGEPISISGRRFERGIGTHAENRLIVSLHGDALRFRAFAGVDDHVGEGNGQVEFLVRGDGRLLWRSGPVRGGGKAVPVDVDIGGVDHLELQVTYGGDGPNCDHADWADARFEFHGKPPRAYHRPQEKAVVLTPLPGPAPRINGPKVFGVRPGSPFLYTVPATGQRPLVFSAEGLPAGLTLDPDSGRVTGRIPEEGVWPAILRVKNSEGEARRPFRIVAGSKFALTPPMGWNSWYAFGSSIDQRTIRQTAEAMVESGLSNHGWSYINLDDGWQGPRGGAFGGLQGNEKFPDMQELANYLHARGLRFGVYSTPWVTSFAGYPGGSSDNPASSTLKSAQEGHYIGEHTFETQDAAQFAEWGVDYLKYDWGTWLPEDVQRMRDALDASGRDVFYSLSCTADFSRPEVWSERSNAWRTGGDLTDNWGSLCDVGFGQNRWARFNRPGHYNDPDMLLIGPNSRLSPNERYTWMTLWSLLSGPLLLSFDLRDLDPFTRGLITNDEVLDVHQDALCRQAGRVGDEGKTEVWTKPLENGDLAAGLFNRDDFTTQTVRLDFAQVGLAGPRIVRDLWRQQDLGAFESAFDAAVPSHGVVLVRLCPPED